MNKVLVVLRHDADNRPGGDTALLKQLGSSLSGFHCDLVVGVPASVVDYEFVICANLDRPVEARSLLRVCNKDKVPLHLLTLHHRHADVELFLRSGVSGWKRIIAVATRYNPVRYEQFLWVVRVVATYISSRLMLPVWGIASAQRELLSGCELILVVSRDERRAIEADIGVISSRVVEVPHFLSDGPHEIGTVRNIIFCPGRIEARKNQIFILEVAKRLPSYEFVFMGRPNTSESNYFQCFRDRMADMKNVKYLEAVGSHEFLCFLLEARVCLTASWFEVTSLIELEVLFNGGRLVTCSPSYNQSFFINPYIFEQNNVSSCVEKVLQAFHAETYRPQGAYPRNEEITSTYLASCEILG